VDGFDRVQDFDKVEKESKFQGPIDMNHYVVLYGLADLESLL